MEERLQKYLARCGLGSRRACEELIRNQQVRVNGLVAELGSNVIPGKDRVEADGREILPPSDLVYWMLNKPIGYVTTVSDPQGRPTVMDLLPPGLPRLFPVGRLDRDSQGLLLFTNDGELTHRLLHPSQHVWKRYLCGLESQPSVATLEQLRQGVELEDGWTAPCRAHWRGGHLEIEIREGRKRQIRRMLSDLGHPVRWLRRVAFGGVELGDLPESESRPLSAAEVSRLRG